MSGTVKSNVKPRKNDLWCHETELKLIEFMRDRPSTWDPTHRDYYQSDHKRTLCHRCALSLGPQFTGEMVRDRWTNMRTTFAANYKRMHLKGRGSPETPVIPTWSLYNHLLFLEATVASRQSHSGPRLSSVSAAEGDCKMDQDESPICRISETSGGSMDADGSQRLQFIPIDFEFTPRDVRSDKYVTEEEYSQQESIGIAGSSSQSREQECGTVIEATVAKEEDEWDDFGKMVSKILRRMPERDAREIQVEFFKILFAKSIRES